MIIRWVESSDFRPKSDDLGHRILKSDFIPSDFAKSVCISRPILFSDRKMKVRRSESDSIINGLRSTIMESKNRKQNRLSPVLKPTQGSGFSCSVFFSVPQPARTAKKDVLFARNTRLPPLVLASRGTDHDQTWRAHAPLNVELSLPSLRAVGGLSRGLAWDGGG